MNWKSEDNPSKVIFQVKESSPGWYRCKVENELNMVFKWFHLSKQILFNVIKRSDFEMCLAFHFDNVTKTMK